MENNYQYKKRTIEKDDSQEFRLGEGRISAYISVTLGILSLLAVIAYLFPEYLTTYELRQAYDAATLQKVLKYGMYFSLFFAILAIILNRGTYKWFGFSALVFTGIAFALGGYGIPVASVEVKPLTLGLDWLILAFLGSVIVFMTIEKVFPQYKDQLILRPEWEIDLFYFCFNHLAITAIIIFANYHVSHFDWAVSESFQEVIRSTPIIIQVALIILCADFVLYWEHRMYHEVNFLWPVHAVHHSIENLDWLAGSRGHFIQVFSERAMVMIPLYLLGVEQTALNIYVVFAALHAILIHCNLGISFGPLKYIFVTPQFHHWHHSSEDPALDTNYAAHTVFFDRLFGTYHMPSEHWPAEYGTVSPLPKTVYGQTLYPIAQLFKHKEAKNKTPK